MNSLVVKDSTQFFMQGTIDIGWRVECQDGHHDSMWGNVKDEKSLRAVIGDIEQRYGLVEIVDERMVEEVELDA